MADPRLILCGGTALTSRAKVWRDAPCVELRLGDGGRDVHLRVEHVSRPLTATPTDVLADLLEVAAFVYAADHTVTRGGTREFEYGRRWRRHFRFEVPVRCPDVWQRADVLAALRETLGFLSDNDCEFAFRLHENPPPLAKYLFDQVDTAGFEEVALFSGGLDSLGGAVREVVTGQRRVVLVSHRPANHVFHRQQELVRRLAGLVPERLRPLHVAVEVNCGEELEADSTQRSRSFLFAAIAAVVARLLGLRRVRFYENGVLSIHLPLSGQLVGARATRTTHPQVLAGLTRLFRLLFDEPTFLVENPYLWSTKAEVLRAIRAARAGALCAATVSCVHTREGTQAQPHCGRCSQCLDRRLAALAAELGPDEDPPGGYATNVLTTPREGTDLALLEGYVGTARRVDAMADAAAFLRAFPEAARVLRHTDVPAAEALRWAFDLYKRHAADVLRVLAEQGQQSLDELVRLRLPPNCLLSLGCGARPRRAAAAPASVAAPAASAPACAAAPQAGAPEQLVLGEGLFEARFRGRPCVLGNTREYHLLERLNRTPNRYVSHNDLSNDVWGDDRTARNTIQCVVSNLRRALRRDGLEVAVDGRQRGHYRLVVPAENSCISA